MDDNGLFDAVMFDFSGTLFRFEEDASWFAGLAGEDGVPFDLAQQAELVRRMTAPVGRTVEMDGEALHAWHNRDLDPALHRRAYLEVLRKSGVHRDDQATALYERVIAPDSWTPYPDTAEVLAAVAGRGMKVAVLSNIAFDIRPAFAAIGAHDHVDAFVLSYEVGAVKPDLEVFRHAIAALGADAGRTLMVGDSDEADGAARWLGCGFALVDPVPVRDRPTGLFEALRGAGVAV